MKKFGDFLTRNKNTIQLEDDISYKQVTVRMHYKGVCLRQEKIGKSIGTKKQYVVDPGQFILSRIDARNGAFGIIPDELDQAIITGDFLAYEVDKNQVDPIYFFYFTRSPSFLLACKRASKGTTNRKRIKEDFFLDQEIDLPELTRQKEIVANIQNIFDLVGDLAETDEDLYVKSRQGISKLFDEFIANCPYEPMSKVAPIIRREVETLPDQLYPELGIRSFGKGTFLKDPIIGKDLGSKRIYQIHKDDLLFSNVFSWEGAIAVVDAEGHERYGSHRFISCVCNPDKVIPKFLWYYFLSDEGLSKIRKASPGSAGRNKTLGLRKLEKIMVPVLPIDIQKKFVHSLDLQTSHKEILDLKKEYCELLRKKVLLEHFK